MKIIKMFLLVIAIVILIVIVGLVILFFIASKRPVVEEGYFDRVKTDKPLEAKYTAKGEYETAYIKFDSENDICKEYSVWYPKKLETGDETYPVVVMANGTGVPASKYAPVFEHLASWGFIVIGNEDASSWNGDSSAESLDYILALNKTEDSLFYCKVNTEKIGIAGHSQGGVGAINAIVNQSNGNLYKTIYTASTTHLDLAQKLKWFYDVSKIEVPYFMTAGTLKADAGDGLENSSNAGIAPLWSLQENFDAVSNDVLKVLARRSGTDHGDMLPFADGYMTAWFMYILKDDTEAGSVFLGDNAEILSNSNWQDIKVNINGR